MNDFVITFDIDWAPDFVIDNVASTLRAKQVCSTWFVTHQCAAVDRLREDPDLFELGIHPNFLPGSTHGNTPAEILAHMLSIVPEATSIRTHSLVQSGPLLEAIITQTALEVDSSLLLPDMPHVQPIEYRLSGRTILRVPIFWGDAYEMEKEAPSWRLTPLRNVEGLKVIAFHPIHVYLNLSDLGTYQDLKQQAPSLIELRKSVADGYIQNGEGAQTFFQELIDHLVDTDRMLRIQDVCTIWNSRRA